MKKLSSRPNVGDIWFHLPTRLRFVVDAVGWDTKLHTVGVTLRASHGKSGRKITIKLSDFSKELIRDESEVAV